MKTFTTSLRQALLIPGAVAILFASIFGQSGSAPAGRAETLEREAMSFTSASNKEQRFSAVAKFEEAIKLYAAAGKTGDAARLYNILGTVWMTLGDYSKRLEAYENALKLYRSILDRDGMALSMLNIGYTYSNAGDNEKALSFMKNAIPQFRMLGNRYYTSAALWSIGGIYDALGSPEKALEYYIAGEGEFSSPNNLLTIANALDRLGRYTEAFDFYKRAEAIQGKNKNEFGYSQTLSSLGTHFARQNKFELAIAHFQLSLDVNDNLPKSFTQRNSAAYTLVELGRAYAQMKETAQAEEAFNKARVAFEGMGDKEGEAFVLGRLGSLYVSEGQFEKAQRSLFDALPLHRMTGNRPGEAFIFDALRQLFSSSGNSRLGISFGKKAVNQLQALRGAIKGMDPKVRTTYLSQVESAYRGLFDLLAAEGRFAEAQAVLEMLKEEEAFEFVQRDASEIDRLNKRADLRDEERTALEKYEELARTVASLGEEFGKLKDRKAALPDGQTLPVIEQKRFDELSVQIEKANTVFQVFLRELSDEFSKKSSVVRDVQENAGLQADLKGWGEGVVAIHTIVSEERYRAILTTPEIQVDGKTEIAAADLNVKIAAFRAAVQDPHVDPRPLGKELYDILIKPIEKHLEGARAKTLLWSLDGSLRYLPLAALWDGQQYFGQKYQNVVITLASRTRLSEEPDRNWRILGLGVTAAKQLPEPDGTRMMSFSALPSVRKELSSIVRDEKFSEGIVSGKTLIDEEFNERSLKDRLAQRFKVVHIASHFSFRPGDMTKSFLLLGDGSALTMDKFKTSPQLRFSGVELLTLSACDTASGETDANGKEVESFAVIAQQNGAKAVLATLWPVADESTAAFMAEFYRTKTARPELNKAEAIRLTQKEMIDGKLKASGQSGGCRAEDFGSGGKTSQFKCDPNAPFSHPYFWSPFILIGNWR